MHFNRVSLRNTHTNNKLTYLHVVQYGANDVPIAFLAEHKCNAAGDADRGVQATGDQKCPESTVTVVSFILILPSKSDKNVFAILGLI